MLRASLFITSFVLINLNPASAQVHTVGDVSFAVPAGWQYQQGPDVGAMTFKTSNRFWLAAVYTPMPSSGDSTADFKAAWKRVVLAVPDYKSIPQYDPYNMTQTVGYPGKYYDAASVSNQTYTRLYTLTTGKVYVPVMFVSLNRGALDSMGHYEEAIVGSVRVAPLKASPIQFSIQLPDLAGFWKGGIVVNTNYYNSSGQRTGNSLTAVNYGYTIAADGRYTYKFGGLMNNMAAHDDDSGVVELGGEFLTFKGKAHVTRYRFVKMQQALDGSTVLTLLPPVDMSQVDLRRDLSYFTRPAKK